MKESRTNPIRLVYLFIYWFTANVFSVVSRWSLSFLFFLFSIKNKSKNFDLIAVYLLKWLDVVDQKVNIGFTVCNVLFLFFCDAKNFELIEWVTWL